MAYDHVYLSRLTSSGIISLNFSLESDTIASSHHFDKPEKKLHEKE